MLLFLNCRRQDVKPIVKSLFKHFGSLGAICDASPTELARFPNLGSGGITLLLLIKGLFYRLDQEQVLGRSVLSNWKAVQNFCIRRLGYSAVEKFIILYLDVQNGVIADEIISIGTVNRTAVFAREVVKKA
jgi:DNA repair protein RadC